MTKLSAENQSKYVNDMEEIHEASTAPHPDVCNACDKVIVPLERLLCDCAYRTCYSCAGRCTKFECPGCRKDISERMMPLIKANLIPLVLSALCLPRYTGFKSELFTLQVSARDDLFYEENGITYQAIQESEIQESQRETVVSVPTSASRNRRIRPRESTAAPAALVPDDEEQQEDTEEQPTASQRRLTKKIETVLEWCTRHNDQREWHTLFTDLQVRGDLRNVVFDAANTMDAATIRAHWTIMSDLIDVSGEFRFLGYLRIGEFCERLSNLASDNQLNGVDEQGDAQHYTSAMDYCRLVFNYSEYKQKSVRSCHYLFLVWKEWHPIIAVSRIPDFSWTWLKDVLPHCRLLVRDSTIVTLNTVNESKRSVCFVESTQSTKRDKQTRVRRE
jgi:hypothetical protein